MGNKCLSTSADHIIQRYLYQPITVLYVVLVQVIPGCSRTLGGLISRSTFCVWPLDAQQICNDFLSTQHKPRDVSLLNNITHSVWQFWALRIYTKSVVILLISYLIQPWNTHMAYWLCHSHSMHNKILAVLNSTLFFTKESQFAKPHFS